MSNGSADTPKGDGGPEKTKQGTRSKWNIEFRIPVFGRVTYERESFKEKVHRVKESKTVKRIKKDQKSKK